ncbi:LLM class flavin-dependent oxidoreductase [Sorangium sp. So ce1000]|uniref:LLM class flavin-dependent oxidoreductase n=1 Tax=Sorangium sp. So ce1000 TaxID=3133325 RepID=UPI003F635DC1
MKFGISFLPDCEPSRRDAQTYYADVLELCRIADRAGMSTVKMTEHYLHPYGGYCPSPLAFLSAVAARTTRIRLMTGCILPVFHHPIGIAAECAQLDAISGGRLDVGFARAYLPYEFEAFGVALDESRARFEASVDAIVRLWTEEKVSMETPYFAFSEVTSLPRPVQRPHPPILGAAVRARQSFAWLGERGFGLLVTSSVTGLDSLATGVRIYRESYAEQHHERSPRVVLSLPLYIAPDERAAQREGHSFLNEYHRVWADAADAWNRTESADYPGYKGVARAIRAARPAEMEAQRTVIVGTPDRVVDRLGELLEMLSVDEIIWQVDFGQMPRARSQRTLELFLEHVAHRFADC